MAIVTITDIPPCPPRPDDAHKGTFGTVIVIGGCATMMGAPALSASAALRGGAGLAKIATVHQAIPVVLTLEPCATAIEREDDAGALIAELDRVDPQQSAVLAVGPGLGQDGSTAALVHAVLKTQRPIVLDADGLNLLASTDVKNCHRDAPLIVTPHPGEYRRLAGAAGIAHDPTSDDERPVAASALAEALDAIVVLKGRHTVVADSKSVYINQTGNPAMATGGSGDVLTGLIAALVAQHMQPMEAAILATYLHGAAGDIWAQQFGPSGMTARDLLNNLPAAFHQHRSN